MISRPCLILQLHLLPNASGFPITVQLTVIALGPLTHSNLFPSYPVLLLLLLTLLSPQIFKSWFLLIIKVLERPFLTMSVKQNSSKPCQLSTHVASSLCLFLRQNLI